MIDSNDIQAMDQELNNLEFLAKRPAPWNEFWNAYFASILRWTDARCAALISLHPSFDTALAIEEIRNSLDVPQPVTALWFKLGQAPLQYSNAEIAATCSPFLKSHLLQANSTCLDEANAHSTQMVMIGQDKQSFAVGLFLRTSLPPHFVLWIEVNHPQDSTSETQFRKDFLHRNEPVLSAMAEVASTFLFYDNRRREMEFQKALPNLISELNKASSLAAFDACLAHDLPSWLNADRVAVVRIVGASPQVRALTGVDTVEQKTDPIVALQHSARVAMLTKSPGFLHTSSQDWGYAFALPISNDTVLIAQWRSAIRMLEGSWQLHSIIGFIDHAKSECDRAPTTLAQLTSGAALWSPTSTWRRWLALLAMLAVGWGISCIPVRFTIEADGFVEPVLQRIVFAPEDGFVERLFVDTETQVQRNSQILQLKSPELELRQQAIAGEWEDATQRRSALNVAINQAPAGDAQLQTLSQQWSAEVAGLDARILSLEEQQRILVQQHQLLMITSPINGLVIKPDLKKRLENRPVLRGDQLLRVAEVTGKWRLRLLVHEQDLGHIRSAWDVDQHQAIVQFRIQSAPHITHTGAITRIASSALREPGQPPTVTVDIELAPGALQVEQVGATARGVIDCGRRPLWYVWTRELTEALMRNFWIGTSLQ